MLHDLSSRLGSIVQYFLDDALIVFDFFVELLVVCLEASVFILVIPALQLDLLDLITQFFSLVIVEHAFDSCSFLLTL